MHIFPCQKNYDYRCCRDVLQIVTPFQSFFVQKILDKNVKTVDTLNIQVCVIKFLKYICHF